MTTINGLLTQKPTSPVPHVGDKKRYSLTQRTGKSGKPWTKIKAEGEGYGQLYEVISVERTDFTDPHGNVSYNVTLNDLSGASASAPEQVGETNTNKDATLLAAPPAQAIRSTSTNGSAAPDLDALSLKFYAALGKADELVTQFFTDAQRETWSAYEAADVVLRVTNSLFIQSYK